MLCTAWASNVPSPEKVTSLMTSNVVRTMSAAMSIGARAGGGNAVTAPLGCVGHNRCQILHVAVGKDRRGGAPLPAPMRPFGDKETVADGRAGAGSW